MEDVEHVRDVQRVKFIWNAIQNVFELHTAIKMFTARRKFYNVTIKYVEKMLKSISFSKQLAYALQSIEGTVQEVEIGLAVISGIP